MMAMPEKRTAETNCQTLGRRGEEGQRQTPSLPPPGPTPGPSPVQARWKDSWSGRRNQGRDYTGPLPTALPPSNTHRSMLT